MPTIYLKPKSPEYADDQPEELVRECDMPGCPEEGGHKAPKDRTLEEHYWFCKAHVAEYNRAWNFFQGMSQREMDDHVFRSYYADRPTWKYRNFTAFQEELYRKSWQAYHNSEQDPFAEARREHKERQKEISRHAPEFEALEILGLEPPLELDEIKARYKSLAKKYHPDISDDPEAEETLKKINMAYTILRVSYDKYQKLEDDKR